MRKVLIIGAASVTAIGMLAGFGAARGMHNGQHAQRFMNFKVDSILEDINATPEQRTQIKQITSQLFNDGRQLHQNTELAHKELLSQLQADKVDSVKMHALVNERIDQLRKFADTAVEDAIKVHDILTPEQRVQLSAEINRHHHDRD